MFCVIICFSLLLLFNLVNCNFEILILHTNDMHSRFDENSVYSTPLGPNENTKDTYGGFARLRQAVVEARKEAKEEGVPSLFLNAGDSFEGTALFALLREEILVPLIQMLGIDVMCLGNHEFDEGTKELARYLNSVKVPTLACNLNLTYEKELQSTNLMPSTVLNVRGQQIGVIGYVTTITQSTSISGNTIFYDEIESVRKEAKKLKSKGVNIIIALGHSGYQKDIEMAQKIPELSLVIGGHSHTFLYTPPDKPPSTEIPEGPYPCIVTQESGKRVPVIQAYAYTKYLGRLWTTFDDYGNFLTVRPSSNPMLLNSKVKLDSSVKEELEHWKKKLQWMKIAAGRVAVKIGSTRLLCRQEECVFGNFLTDAIIYYIMSNYKGSLGWTDVPIALVHGGNIQSPYDPNIFKREITYEEIMSMLPHRTEIVKVRVTGKTLREIMETSVKDFIPELRKQMHSALLQVSGIHVKYDILRPPGKRIIKLKVRCGNCTVPTFEPVNDDLLYTVAMPYYISLGKEQYSMLENTSSEPVLYRNNTLTDVNAVLLYLKKLGNVYAEVEGRITFCGTSNSSASSFNYASLLNFWIALFIYMII